MQTAVQQMFRQVGRSFLDVLFPPLCLSCRTPVSEPNALCSDCWQDIQFLDGPMCDCCGLPFEWDPGVATLCAACHANRPVFDQARAVMRYDAKSRGPILALKHADRLDLSIAFGRWLERSGRQLLKETDVILPVPLHAMRLWARRYHQSAELAKTLGREARRPVELGALVRTRRTPSQGTMPSARARRRNMQGAFAVKASHKSAITGRNVLLVDDVLTTGATVNACARALKRAGAAKVLVLTLARVVRPLAGDII